MPCREFGNDCNAHSEPHKQVKTCHDYDGNVGFHKCSLQLQTRAEECTAFTFGLGL